MKSPDDALSWYEASLPLKERKRRGHFSTPPSLVEQILDACDYLPGTDLAHIRVLDPACGGGNFLAAAAQRLLAFARLRELDQAAQIALAQRNLWGFDPDPVACFLAEMQLRTAMEEAWQGQVWHSQETPSGACTLQVHQADGLSLPWEPCVDLFLANPPYLAAKNTDLSGYQSAQQRGQADSYLLFLSCALQVVRPGGWIGMVLPDPLLARANAARERTHLLKDATIRHIWHLSGVFTAEVGAVVIIAQKCPPPPVHPVSWIRGKWQRNAGQQLIAPRANSDKTNHGVVGIQPGGQVSRFIAPTQHDVPLRYQTGVTLQSLFLKQPRAELRYFLNDKRGSITERLRSYLEAEHSPPSRLAPLDKFLSISRGEELGKESPYISPSPQPECYPVLRGGIDVRQYKAPIGNWYIPREAISKPLERYLSPKLIVVKSTDHLQAALDTRGHITLQTLYLLHLRTGINVGATLTVASADTPVNALEDTLDDLYFFLALLNSQLLRDYVYMLHTAYKWVQPQIEQSVLARLPVPIVKAWERKHVIELSKLLERACSAEDTVVEWKRPIRSLYEEQEHAIRTLYAAALPELFTATAIHCPG